MIDFTGKTYLSLLVAMLARVPNDVDKREESLVNTALGPAAYALEEAYLDLSRMQQGGHIQTAVGVDLDLATGDVGITRRPASAAVRLGVFDADVPLGARFSTNEAAPVTFTAMGRVSAGRYRLTCETAGAAGNLYMGPLMAITFVPGLGTAELSDILIPGADEEDDETLRGRCMEHLNSKPFGGNVASYREAVGAMAGVGGVQVYPTWAGGGTVKIAIVGADYRPAPDTLLQTVQNAVDPEANGGEGYGMAPIGATVTVSAPTEVTVDVSAVVTVVQGYTLEQVRPLIEAAVGEYIAALRTQWATPISSGTTQYALAVYRARVITAMLLVQGVVNATSLTLNGGDADLTLYQTGERQELPVMGTVVLSLGS